MEDGGVDEPHCPLCGGRKFQQKRLGLLTCTDCELTLSPAIWQPLANEVLEEEWFGEGYESHTSVWVKLFETWNNSRTVKRVTRARLHGRRLLEIGVGTGSFLQEARKKGFEVLGCDLSRTICERVKRERGLPMHCGPLAELGGAGSFDVVVMNHILEHVSAPVALLHDVYRLLRPGGVVHIAVPNIACLESALPGWTSYEPYHLTYFKPDTLKRAVIASGFSIEREETHESFSGWFLAVLRTGLGVNRGGAVGRTNPRGGQASSDSPRSMVVENAYRLAMVVAGGLLWPLRILQAILGRGDEVICVARKPEPEVVG
jgi:2-polyprenyl-3-methyl-5-hydroxy-6-metoxy-1,4-benzoquinol methylase